ncbi:MAG: PrsW family intramembrane metalloprotease [Anaerolineales bacterium]|nr:PrsW family intramembrane metalloprotease [Anaerolineales bacterium]
MSETRSARPLARHLPALSQADFASVVALVVFVILIFLFEWVFAPSFTQLTLILTGIIMSLVPAAIWLGFFYRRDRLEPEPKHMILQIFVLGGLVASAIGIPVLNNLFDVPNWLNATPVTKFFGGILVVGFLQEYLKYAVVRFSIFDSAEFDEPVDGVIYATAAGVGYATMLNIYFVFESGGAELGLAAIRIVVTALAHASFAGIMGYFIGQEKFLDKPLWWMPAGIAAAATANGFFFYLRGELAQGSGNMVSGGANQWVGLLLAIVLTVGVTYQLTTAMEKQVTAGEEV